MEEDNKQTSVTDPSDVSQSDVNQDGENQGGDGDAGSVGSTVDISYINKELGTEFKSIEDLRKKYTGLNSLVGDQEVAKARELAERYQSITQKIKDKAEAEGVEPDTYLEALIETSTEEDGERDLKSTIAEKVENEKIKNLENKVLTYEEKFAKADLRASLGEEALRYFDDFRRWAGDDLSVDNFKKSPFMSLVEADRQVGSSTVETNSRINTSVSKEYQIAFSKAQKSGRKEDWAEVLRLKRELKK